MRMSDQLGKIYDDEQGLKTESELESKFSKQVITVTSREIFGVLGMALSWAWYYSVFFSHLVILPFDPLLRTEPLFRLSGLVGIAFGYLLLLVLSKYLIRHSVRVILFLLLSLIPIALVVLTAVSMYEERLYVGSEFICWALAGLSVSFFTMNQILFLGTVDKPSKRYYSIALSLVVGAFIYVLLNAVSSPLSLIFLATIPALSATFFYISNHSKPVDHSLRRVAQKSLLQSVRACAHIVPNRLLHGIVFGLTLNVAISLAVNITGAFSPIIGAALCLPGLVLLVLLLLGKGTLSLELTQWIPVVFMTVALILSLLLESWWMIAALSVAAFCFVLFQGTHMAELSEIINEEQEDGLIVLLVSMAVVSAGIAFGWGAGCFMLIEYNYEHISFSWSVAGAAILLVLSLAWQSRPGTQRTTILHLNRKQADSPGRWRRSVSSLCETVGLSQRQSEIFAYLARGRNASSIARELIVSEHTVKAHIYRIYQKMEIHSQQELIDLVEEEIKRTQ